MNKEYFQLNNRKYVYYFLMPLASTGFNPIKVQKMFVVVGGGLEEARKHRICVGGRKLGWGRKWVALPLWE